MTTSANGTPRKPSGSSSHSTGHSPIGSPSTGHGQRKLNATAVFGVGMSGPGLKGINNGWPVWGNGSSHPNSKRTASLSSATSMTDPSTTENGLRPEGAWPGSRPSPAWDLTGSPAAPGDVGSPNKKDQGLYSPNNTLSLQQARQRQATAAQAAALSAPRIVSMGHEEDKRLLDDTERTTKSSFSPQRFDNSAGKTASPVKGTVYGPSSPFPAQTTTLNSHTNGGQIVFDSLHSVPVDDLSLGLRNLAVEDEYRQNQGAPVYRAPQQPPSAPHAQGLPIPQIRAPHIQPPPPRPAYPAYPQGEYGSYYPPAHPGREQFPGVEYSYGYEYRATNEPAALYASPPPAPAMGQPSGALYPQAQPVHPGHAHADMHRTPSGVFYEYSGAPRPSGSPYFYPAPQPMVFHPAPPAHSPLPNHSLAHVLPAGLQDKKREMQYPMQQHQQMPHQQNLLFNNNMRHSTPSPHAQGYPVAMEYTGQLPVLIGANLMPGTPVYTHAAPNTHPIHLYQGMKPGRRIDGAESSLRSQLLDDFRSNKARKWELRDIFGYVVEFSGDQHGSRFIQQKLETATIEEKQVIFDEIVPTNALQLIQDVFGNYVIQKLFEHGSQAQKTQLASTMEGHILQLSMQMYGCRVVQKAVEYVLPEQQAAFVKELDSHVLRCVKDANGNHVIQKLIERVKPERLGFVQSFRGSVFELSTHPYGCRVLQRCFEHLSEEQNRPLLDELHKYTTNLMQDQFGNYVVQFVLEYGKVEDRNMIISKLRGQMLHMAKHKFASNVCEKALVVAELETRKALIDELIAPRPDGSSPIAAMMKDQYANYVLQRCLSVVDPVQREELINRIKPQLATMRKYSSSYTKHLSSIERLLEKFAQGKMGEKGDE